MAPANLLFPVETINRELDFRLFLAAMYVRTGERVFIGRDDVLMRLVSCMRGGVLVGKVFDPTFPNADMTKYEKLKANRIRYVHVDEEGGVIQGGEPEWERELMRRLDVSRLATEDYVTTWGEFQKDFYQSKSPKHAEHIVNTGHPRFDLYKPEYRTYFDESVRELKKEFGEFILLNTNLVIANNGTGIARTFSKRYGWDTSSTAKRISHLEYWGHATDTLVRFVQLINRLSIEFPQYTFVIRPHPSEDVSFYQTVFCDIPNVKVLHRGPVAPWLFACKAIIHDGCTTAIESYLGNVPIINYKSVINPKYDQYIPNLFGTQVNTQEQVIDCIRQLEAGQPLTTTIDLPRRAAKLMRNFEQVSFEPMLQLIRQAVDESVANDAQSFDEKKFSWIDRTAQTKERAKDVLRPLSPTWQRNAAYSKNKFYGFKLAAIPERMTAIEKILHKSVKTRIVSDTLLMLEGLSFFSLKFSFLPLILGPHSINVGP